MRALLPLLFSVMLILLGSAHTDPFPKDYFRSPLDIPLYLSGSFAEMRSNHFHAGLDIKTQGREGLIVHAAADGWVSRINVSPTGYGNALYISHPNGYQSVYAHLDRFSEEIQAHIKNLQYANESFDIQTFPESVAFPVKKGDIIAFSGNTGGSGGPHLHFEIRDQATAEPLNPMLFGMPIQDTIAPRIFRIKVYAVDVNSTVRIEDRLSGGWRTLQYGESAVLDVARTQSGLALERAGRIEATGRIGFGIQTHDYHDGSNNQLGAFRIRLDANNTTVHSTEFERFSFTETRYLNAHVDYGEYQTSRRWIQRSFQLPGNVLPLYSSVNSGFVDVPTDGILEMTYTVSDATGNTSRLGFTLHGMQDATPPRGTEEHDNRVQWSAPFTFTREDMSVRIPAGAVYDSFDFTYERLPATARSWSDRHRIHRSTEPIHSSVQIRIAADDVPTHLRDKVLLGRFDDRGNVSSAGGSWSYGNVVGTTRSFGVFGIVADTTAPSIRPLNISPGASLRSVPSIRLRIRDDLSGLATFNGYIDGQWRLFEYDAKNSLFTHYFDDLTVAGDHVLTVRVVDNKGNAATLDVPFRR